MLDYQKIVSEIRIAACGAEKPSSRLLLMQLAADAIEELIKTSRRWELEAAANEKDKQYLVDENRRLVDSLMNLLVQKWISVEERLPEVGIDVLVTDGSDVCISHQVRYVSPTERFTFWSRDDLDLTHWMPLPSAPKEDAE